MMRRVLGTAVLIGGLAMSGEGRADVILSGPDADDGDYSTAALAADATGGDTASAGGLTGVSLWGLLGGANAASSTSPVYGAITTSTPAGDGRSCWTRGAALAFPPRSALPREASSPR